MNRNWTAASPALQPLPQTTIDLQQKKKKEKKKDKNKHWILTVHATVRGLLM